MQSYKKDTMLKAVGSIATLLTQVKTSYRDMEICFNTGKAQG